MHWSAEGRGRRSVRLPGYDYAAAGAYFVTIVVQERRQLLSSIENGRVQLSAQGKLVDGWWQAIPQRFTGVRLDAHVIMPDHFHGIVILGDGVLHKESAVSLAQVIGWFKTMVTNDYIRHIRSGDFPEFTRRLWQRNYYEHIVRDEQDLARIRHYIVTNPAQWNPAQQDLRPAWLNTVPL